MHTLPIEAAKAAGAALHEALRRPGSEDARWQAGTGGTQDKKRSTDCAALSRRLATAPGVTMRGAA